MLQALKTEPRLEHFPDVLYDLNQFFLPQKHSYLGLPDPLFAYDTTSIHPEIFRAADTEEVKQRLKQLSALCHLHSDTPLLFLILHFGQDAWQEQPSNSATSYVRYLFTVFPQSTPIAQILVVNVSFLSSAFRSRFVSDFRIVADYFSALRNRRFARIRFHPQPIRHLQALLSLLGDYSEDARFQSAQSYFDNLAQPMEGGVNMCKIMDYAEAQGVNRGFTLGLEQGIYWELYRLTQKELLSLEEAAAERRMSSEELIYKWKSLGIL